jgi:hypothetical protein
VRRWSPLLLGIALAPLGACFAQRPPIVVPGSADTVLERLPSGYAALMPGNGARRAPLVDAQALLATAARTGDARLATRAEALLAAIPVAQRSTTVQKARAFAAQHRHDFAGALSILSAVIARQPRDADARLARAQIQLVQGRIDRARADCAALALGVDADAGMLCIAGVAMRQGDYTTAAGLLDRWLARPATGQATLRHVLVLRGEAASRANDPAADAWFRRALALSRDDVRTLAAYARHLRAHGRAREVLALLASAPETDSLALQRVLAAHALRTSDAPGLAAAQARRYALAHALGTQPELRDEAEFALVLRGDAATALALAQRNFATQRDVEDLDILLRAAVAARRPDVVADARAWMRAQDAVQPAFDHG